MRPSIYYVATALGNLRKAHGVSQRELAARIGLTQAQISKIEGGRVDPRLSSVVELARGLGAEVMLVPRRVVPAALALGALPADTGVTKGEGDG